MFEGLARDQLSIIAFMTGRRRYRHGSVIIEQDKPGTAGYVILSGAAERSQPDTGALPQILGPGSLIGELAMFVETTHTTSVYARGNVMALEIKREIMQALIVRDPALADVMSRYIRRRIGAFAEGIQRIERSLRPPAPVSFGEDRMSPEPAHDPMAFASPEPRQSPEDLWPQS